MPTPGPSLAPWIGRLRGWGQSTGHPAPGLPGLADELGHRRSVDQHFSQWRAGRSGVDPPGPVAAGPSLGNPVEHTDTILWRACLDPSMSLEAPLAALDAPERRGGRSSADAGALVPQGLHRALEVWTETELASLHALRWLAHLRGRPEWRRRALGCARWHVENLQPDNATNRPWAIHVFLELSVAESIPEAELYAQTLLHNCMVTLGHPDRLSAAILLDAADALEAMT